MRNLPVVEWLMVLVLVMNFSSKSEAGFKQAVTHIHITNNLRPDMDLTLHCKSNSSLQWNLPLPFSTRLLGYHTVLLLLSMEIYTSLFDIFISNRDHHLCNTCLWKIRATGPCMLSNKSGFYDICYNWYPSFSIYP